MCPQQCVLVYQDLYARTTLPQAITPCHLGARTTLQQASGDQNLSAKVNLHTLMLGLPYSKQQGTKTLVPRLTYTR